MGQAPVPRAPRLLASPKKVDVALTGACNLTCGYCSYNAVRGPGHAEDMSTAELETLFDELGELAVMDVTLTGGEPLLRPDFLQIVRAVVRNRMRFSVNTNGVLMTQEIAEALAATKRLNVIQISIDGAEDWNDKNRGKGAFAGAIRGVRILRDLAVNRRVRLTITRFTADHLAETLEGLLDVVHEVGTNELMPYGRGLGAYEKMAITDEQRPRVTETLVRFAERYPGRVTASAGPLAIARDTEAYKRQVAEGEPHGRNGAGHLSSCGGFHDSLAILHDGSIVPCIQIPDLKLGRVGQVSLQELWNNHATLRELRERWNIPLDAIEYCKGCKYIPFCHGGCPANAVSVFGTHLAPDPVHCMRRLIDGLEHGNPGPVGVVHRGGGSVRLRVV